jgi:hypothetical protein
LLFKVQEFSFFQKAIVHYFNYLNIMHLYKNGEGGNPAAMQQYPMVENISEIGGAQYDPFP